VIERRGWREQPPPTETFTAVTGKFTVTCPEGVWEKQDAKGDDERGALMLYGRYKKEKDNRKSANFFVFTIDHQKDLKEAMQTAREEVEKMKKEENSNYKLVSASERDANVEGQSAAGESENIGDRPGRMADLCLKIGEDAKRYVLLGVVNERDVCYVFRCDCTWDSRQIWRQDFLELLHMFKLKKGE
jgi:hypothetical protein